MTDLLPTALALLAVALMGAALLAMAGGELMAAGLSFLSASLVLYLRETRFAGD